MHIIRRVLGPPKPFQDIRQIQKITTYSQMWEYKKKTCKMIYEHRGIRIKGYDYDIYGFHVCLYTIQQSRIAAVCAFRNVLLGFLQLTMRVFS